MMDEEDREFTTIEYKGEDVEVTYDLLVDVYDKVIRKVFNDKLDEMIAYMDKNGIRYMDGSKDNFKIALVGGFGNFYLVQKQIEDKFKFSTYDKRREDIIQQKEDCETGDFSGCGAFSFQCDQNPQYSRIFHRCTLL